MDVYKNIREGKYTNKTPWSRENKKEYDAESSIIYDQFKKDLENQYHLKTHPKKDRLFELSWEHGHAHGYEEVWIHYSSLQELLQP